jgi:hypothetical protein
MPFEVVLCPISARSASVDHRTRRGRHVPQGQQEKYVAVRRGNFSSATTIGKTRTLSVPLFRGADITLTNNRYLKAMMANSLKAREEVSWRFDLSF